MLVLVLREPQAGYLMEKIPPWIGSTLHTAGWTLNLPAVIIQLHPQEKQGCQYSQFPYYTKHPHCPSFPQFSSGRDSTWNHRLSFPQICGKAWGTACSVRVLLVWGSRGPLLPVGQSTSLQLKVVTPEETCPKYSANLDAPSRGPICWSFFSAY